MRQTRTQTQALAKARTQALKQALIQPRTHDGLHNSITEIEADSNVILPSEHMNEKRC